MLELLGPKRAMTGYTPLSNNALVSAELEKTVQAESGASVGLL